MALTLLSCSRDGSNKDASSEWGYTEYYESTSLKKYTPVPMDGVFEIELNNHASQMFKEGGSVTFEVVETREGEELPLQYIDVYTHNGNEEWYLQLIFLTAMLTRQQRHWNYHCASYLMVWQTMDATI